MPIADNIKESAKRHNIKMREIAKKLDIKPSNLSRIIKSPRITLEDMVAIAGAIGCEVGEFFQTVEEQPENALSCPYCGMPISFIKATGGGKGKK